VNDGNVDTRWASTAEDSQWLKLDFVKPVKAHELAILWEDAYASEYSVALTSDGRETEIFKTDKGAKGLVSIKTPDIPFSSVSLKCAKRGLSGDFRTRDWNIFEVRSGSGRLFRNVEGFAVHGQMEEGRCD